MKNLEDLVARIHVLEEGLRLALDNSIMPRQLVVSLTALLPDDATGKLDPAPQEYRED